MMLISSQLKPLFLQGPTGPIGPPGPAGQPGDKVTSTIANKVNLCFSEDQRNDSVIWSFLRVKVVPLDFRV